MELETVTTSHAPAAIGPYSQAIVAGDQVYVSGQIPLDPQTGELVAGGIEAQTRRALDNLSAVLTAAGTSLDRVVRTTIFLADLADFGTVNSIYAEYFTQHRPARVTVQVAALPRDARIEIDAIAVR